MIFTSVLKTAQHIPPQSSNTKRCEYAILFLAAAANKKNAAFTSMNPLNRVKWKSNRVTTKNYLEFWTDDTASGNPLSSK